MVWENTKCDLVLHRDHQLDASVPLAGECQSKDEQRPFTIGGDLQPYRGAYIDRCVADSDTSAVGELDDSRLE